MSSAAEARSPHGVTVTGPGGRPPGDTTVIDVWSQSPVVPVVPNGTNGTTTAAAATAAGAVSVASVVAVIGVQLIVPGGWGSCGWAVLVAGLVLGLPHGAVDHLVPAFALGPRAPRLPVIVTVYTATAVVAWLVFRAVPGPALAVFVLVSVAHFGTGEVLFEAGRSTRPPTHHRLIHPADVLAYGGAPLLLPMAIHPGSVATTVAMLVPGSSGRLPGWATTSIIATVLAAAALSCAQHLRDGRRPAAAQIALLVLLGLLVPPAPAFGVYFGGWHSLRHIARLIRADPANTHDLAAGHLLFPLGRFIRHAALPTAAALVALLTLWAVAGGWATFVTTDLALLAGLTVPHALLVTWWDHQARTGPAVGGSTGRPAGPAPSWSP